MPSGWLDHTHAIRVSSTVLLRLDAGLTLPNAAADEGWGQLSCGCHGYSPTRGSQQQYRLGLQHGFGWQVTHISLYCPTVTSPVLLLFGMLKSSTSFTLQSFHHILEHYNGSYCRLTMWWAPSGLPFDIFLKIHFIYLHVCVCVIYILHQFYIPPSNCESIIDVRPFVIQFLP